MSWIFVLPRCVGLWAILYSSDRHVRCSVCVLRGQVTLAHAQEANTRIVEQLNDQVDFLNNQLALREKQLSEVRLS